MLPHVLNLALHGQKEQRDEVKQQNWPEDRYVEKVEERHAKCDERCLAGRIPARAR